MRNTTLCYIERDGAYLMLHRVKRESDINRDKWIGIGGGLLPGESPEDCLKREVYEETGLTLNSFRLRGIITFITEKPGTEYMFLYTSDDFSGTPGECDEGVLEWVPKELVPTLPIWEGDRVFLRLLDEDRPFFSLKLIYSENTLIGAELDGFSL